MSFNYSLCRMAHLAWGVNRGCIKKGCVGGRCVVWTGAACMRLCLKDSLFLSYTHLSIGDSWASIRLCSFVRLLSSSIWVVISSTLMVWLANVLGCKCTVNFTFPLAFDTTLHSYLCSCLQPKKLIGADVFFFWEVGTITDHHCWEYKGTE